MKKKTARQKLVLYLPGTLPALAMVAVMALLLSASAAYILLAPASVEVSAESGSIVADGATGTGVFAEVRGVLGLPVPFAYVQFSADRGSLDSESCTADAFGRCATSFTPVKSLSAQAATITARSGGASDYTIVSMAGDIAKRLGIGLEYPSLPANGYSTSTITITAYDWMGNHAPDGSEVTASVSPADSGTFSDDGMCYTVNGRCSITFTGSVNPGEATVSAASGDARTSAAIRLLAIPPENVMLSLSAQSIPADGQATVLATVSVTDELGNPVPSQQVSASSNMGTLDRRSCQTDSGGNCGFTYTAGTAPGTETITAALEGYDLSASRQLILAPVSDLGVSMMAYENVGNPIIPAFARSVAFHGHDMARLIIENRGNSRFEGTVSVEVSGWSERSTESIGIDAGDTADMTFSPPLKDAAYENLDSVPVNYLVVITGRDGKEAFRNTYPATLAPYNTMVWGGIWDNMIAAWDTPSAPAIHELVAEASEYTPWESIVGYQEMSGYTHEEITHYQLKAIYEALQDRGMRYVNAPFALSGEQTVYAPAQSLAVNGGNCIDGTMVFASALTSMGMEPLVVLTSNHAFICVRTWYDSDYIQCVETTMLGNSDFDSAKEEGKDEFEEYRNQPGFKTVNVNSAIENGVSPLPS